MPTTGVRVMQKYNHTLKNQINNQIINFFSGQKKALDRN